MSTISGSVYFNQTNSAPLSGIKCPNIPIGLYDSFGMGLIILTNSTGDFSFINVPNGTYTLVEAGGQTATTINPGDFSTAINIGMIPAADPSITLMTSPPATATNTQSFSPNTIYITINGVDVTGKNFFDAPVRDIGVDKSGLTVGPNLLTTAGNGTIGTLPAGTSPNTQPYPTVLYSNICTGFIYAQQTAASPNDGYYAINNITNTNSFGWLNSADHTFRDETGRQLIINGANPGGLIFTETISNLTPNSLYYASIWIMNLLPNAALPQLGVRLKSTNGTTIFNLALSNITGYSFPTWQETATPINIGNNTSVVYEVYSNGPAAGGNDYAIDDIGFQSIIINGGIELNKSVNKSFAQVWEELIYTITLKNTSMYTITNTTFKDSIPNSTSFVSGSITLDFVTLPTANLNTGIGIASMASGRVSTITFKVIVITTPSNNTVINQGMADYSVTPVVGGAVVTNTTISNIVVTTVVNPKVTLIKDIDLKYATIGSILTYTLVMNNTGNIALKNLKFIDTVPSGTQFKLDSLFINGVNQAGVILDGGITVPDLNINETNTIVFQVNVI